MEVDYLVVGSGLTGAVVARLLTDAKRDVLVVDRRPHVGGNVHDHAHPSGIRVHTYGPHYFRTSSEKIWDFATRFGEFYMYEAAVLSDIDGDLVQWPIAGSYIRQTVSKHWVPEFCGTPSNFEEAALKLMPRIVYERFVKEYNLKQWGVPCTELSAGLCSRFDVRHDDEPRLTPTALHQGIPTMGYGAWMQSMLAGVPTILNYDFLHRADEIKVKKHMVFTGPIDEFFGYDLGRLAYRGQKRQHTYFADKRFIQPVGQVNNPLMRGGPHIRTLEWLHMMHPEFRHRMPGTILTTETPFSPTDPSQYEYPFPSQINAALYEKYRKRASSIDKVTIAGRLGEYRYYDMDQAIGRALVIAERLLSGGR